jgi:hypothetical protein
LACITWYVTRKLTQLSAPKITFQSTAFGLKRIASKRDRFERHDTKRGLELQVEAHFAGWKGAASSIDLSRWI